MWRLISYLTGRLLEKATESVLDIQGEDDEADEGEEGQEETEHADTQEHAEAPELKKNV